MATSISVITVVRNNPLVAETVESILRQDFDGPVDSIVIDGASSDGTLEALAPFRSRIGRLVSEPDHGIYDAMNKGLSFASSELIGFLNAGDTYEGPGVLRRVAAAFEDPAVEALYGDLVYVREQDPSRVLRYWRSGPPDPKAFRWGWMPPHPTFFARRSVYERFGGFDPRYRIASDFELMLRFLGRHGVACAYLPQVLVRMRAGGASNASLRNIWQANAECRQAFRDLSLPRTPLFTPLKLLRHAAQLLHRP